VGVVVDVAGEYLFDLLFLAEDLFVLINQHFL
jgi:hypothetical protein